VDKKDKNLLDLEYLRILESMIKLGLYKLEKDLISLIDPLVSLLDGSLDLYSKEQIDHYKQQMDANRNDPKFIPEPYQEKDDQIKKKRFEKSQENEIVMEIKSKILDILSLIMDIQDDKRLSLFLIKFHEYVEGMEPMDFDYLKKMYEASLSSDIRAMTDLKNKEEYQEVN